MESITQSQVLLAIAGGTCDDDLDALYDTYKERTKFVRSLTVLENYTTIMIGQRVMTANIRPKYLSGLTGEVTHKDGKNFVVLLDPDQRASAKRYIGPEGTMRLKPNMVKAL